MGRNIYINNCIREVRQCVYGRDNRKPIADAIEQIKSYGRFIHRLNRMDMELNHDVIDWIEKVPRTVYVNFEAESDTTDLSVSLISGEDNLLTDLRSSDAISVIENDDHLLSFGENWDADELEQGSFVVYDDVPHYETYYLVLS